MSPKDDGYILTKSSCTIFHFKNTNRTAYSNALVGIRKYEKEKVLVGLVVSTQPQLGQQRPFPLTRSTHRVHKKREYTTIHSKIVQYFEFIQDRLTHETIIPNITFKAKNQTVIISGNLVLLVTATMAAAKYVGSYLLTLDTHTRRCGIFRSGHILFTVFRYASNRVGQVMILLNHLVNI
jgi:hypothetical protein